MGIPGTLNPFRRFIGPLLTAFLASAPLLAQTPPAPTAVQAISVPLILPAGLAYGSQGNLLFAESGNHLIRQLSPSGTLTTFAGTGVQGFAGDGGPAQASLLDSPSAVAIDANGNVFFADTHNHRIRQVAATSGRITTYAGDGEPGQSPDGTLASAAKLDSPCALAFDSGGNLLFADSRTHLVRRIDHATGLIATLAGDGTEGFRGDLGPALSAALDTPSGIALDAADNLFIADMHNQRIRRVDHRTGIITTVAGTGQIGFSGDSAPASAAALALPRNLAVDSAGNLFVVDAGNQRIRRIDAVTGQITSVAGQGTQAFAGDAGAATSASLNAPRAIALSPDGLPTIADTANQRIRQIDANATIRTIAGLGASASANLTLSAASVLTYGTGSVTATLAASPATGSVTLFDHPLGATRTIASIPLVANSVTFPIAELAAGVHRLSATYAGDATHAPAQSNALNLSISAQTVNATLTPQSLAFGQPVAVLTGTLSGVLPQDAAAGVSLQLTSAAGNLSPPGLYPIVASLAGSAAGNYTLTTSPASILIAKALPAVTLSTALLVHVASPTAGSPRGTVMLLDGGNLFATSPLSPSGDAAFSSATLSLGTHSFTAAYSGDQNFLAATSAPALVSIGPSDPAPVTKEDFSLNATGPGSVSIVSGAAATFAFAVTPVNGQLASPIVLSTSGLPLGATASFNPAILPPGNAINAFTLTVQTIPIAKQAHVQLPTRMTPFVFAALLPLLLLTKKRRPRALLLALLSVSTFGCGDRVNRAADGTVAATHSYNITVSGTATSSTGATLVHTANVTLILQ